MLLRIMRGGFALAGLFVFLGTASADNLVFNGDFSAGAVGFSTGYNAAVNNNCWPETTYTIVVSPNDCHPLWASFGDHTTGTGNMLVVNGATTANVLVWGQGTAVTPNTDYTFSAWVASAYSASPAVLDFSINGTQIGTDFVASSTTGLWQEFTGTWNSGASTTAGLTIIDKNTEAGGNDFALDDISLATTTATPEPGYFVFVGTGLAGLFLVRRRKTRAQPATN